MPTLLLRLQGPLQSWATDPRTEVTVSQWEPSKSGVVGLLSAALGRRREHSVNDLAQLRMGVRIDRRGSLLTDFQTAQEVVSASGKVVHNSLVTKRIYLEDAAFLIGLEGPEERLKLLYSALAVPRRSLYLGRKSCVPSPPPFLPDGLRETGLESALGNYPPLDRRRNGDLPNNYETVIEVDEVTPDLHYDQPISNFRERAFGPRYIRRDVIVARNVSEPLVSEQPEQVRDPGQ